MSVGIPPLGEPERKNMAEEENTPAFQKYEITFILDENSKPESVLKIFVKEGIEQGELRDLGMKRFAYKIGKLEAGRYFALVFLTETSKLRDLERNLRLEKDIVRHLIVKVEHEKMKALHEQKQAARNMKKAAAAMEEKKVSEQPKDNRQPAKAPIAKTAEAPEIPTSNDRGSDHNVGEKPVEKVKEVTAKPSVEKSPEDKKPEKASMSETAGDPTGSSNKIVGESVVGKPAKAKTIKKTKVKQKAAKKPKNAESPEQIRGEKIVKKELDKKLEELVED